MDLNLVVLRAEDPDALVAFYEALGLTFDREQHDRGPPHHSSRTGQVVMEIYPMQSHAPTTSTRIGFVVDDLARSCAIAARSGRIIRSPTPGPLGLGAVIEDPAGHKVELVQRRSISS